MTSPDHIHAYHIGVSIIALVIVAFCWYARGFLRECFSETVGGKSLGSHKRIIAFMLILTMCFCEMYHTLKQGKLEYEHLVAFLTGAATYSGIAAWLQSQKKETPGTTTNSSADTK